MKNQTVLIPEQYKNAVENVIAAENCDLNTMITKLCSTYFVNLIDSDFKLKANHFFEVIELMYRSGLSPFRGEIYPVVTVNGQVKHLGTLDGWLKVGRSLAISKTSFNYSEATTELVLSSGTFPAPVWVEATVVTDKTTVTMREYLLEHYEASNDSWAKPMSRLRYASLVQCYRILAGLDELGEEQSIKSEQLSAINESMNNHLQKQQTATVPNVDDAVIQEVEETESAINSMGEPVEPEHAHSHINETTQDEAQPSVQESEVIDGVQIEDVVDEPEAEPKIVEDLPEKAEPQQTSQKDDEIVIREDAVNVRVYSIVNQYIQGIKGDLWDISVLEQYRDKKVTNAHDIAWINSKIASLK